MFAPVLLPGFTHRPGVHCGSTALSDALRVRGLDITEAMAFGLGAGPRLLLPRLPGAQPHAHHPGAARGPLEETACDVLGAPVAIRTENDPALRLVGRPRRPRPRLRPRPLHRPALPARTGRPRPRSTATASCWPATTRAGEWRFLADTEREELQEVPLADLERARASDGQPLGFTGRQWMEIDAPRAPVRWREAVADALRRQARQMLLPVDGYAGVSGLERFAAEVPRWHELARDEADRAWCFRFAYQCIERRGTGGGNFRLLYARFLAEAALHHPGVAALGLPGPDGRDRRRLDSAGKLVQGSLRTARRAGVGGGGRPGSGAGGGRAPVPRGRGGPGERMTDANTAARARFAALLERPRIPLDEAALAIAAEEYPDLDPGPTLAALDAIAARVGERGRRPPAARSGSSRPCGRCSGPRASRATRRSTTTRATRS